MGWGIKIALGFSSFVVLIITMVVISMSQKDIHLVTEKYYEKEIAYQEQIDIETNTAALKEIPVIVYSREKEELTITYPEQFDENTTTGSILFFRPSDANQDFLIPITAESSLQQNIALSRLQKGLWKIKMEWTAAQKKYYIEERLVIL